MVSRRYYEKCLQSQAADDHAEASKTSSSHSRSGRKCRGSNAYAHVLASSCAYLMRMSANMHNHKYVCTVRNHATVLAPGAGMVNGWSRKDEGDCVDSCAGDVSDTRLLTLGTPWLHGVLLTLRLYIVANCVRCC